MPIHYAHPEYRWFTRCGRRADRVLTLGPETTLQTVSDRLRLALTPAIRSNGKPRISDFGDPCPDCEREGPW